MSKQTKRKITVDVGGKALETVRPSVFERLGTKKASSKKAGEREHCRQWAAHGVCAYGKGCKFAATHTLVSPSKARAAGKEETSSAARLHSAVVRADELDTWDQNDLEYADTDVLEKRRLQLQRELELQLKMESGKEQRMGKKKPPSIASSRSSSSSSASSTSSGGSTSNTSSGRDGKKKSKKGKSKRNSSSSSEGDVPSKKKKLHKEVPPRGKGVPPKKAPPKKDDRLTKKHDSAAPKKKVVLKLTLGKKSLSPGKKSGATSLVNKGLAAKSYVASKHSKSPARREKNRSISPPSAKDKDRDRQREREREKEKERERRGKSRSLPRKARSRSPLRKEPRRKDSSERGRPISPKKARRDQSTDKHRKSPTRDRDRRDHKDRSLERRKEEKERHEREKLLMRQRERDRLKDTKRDTSKRILERREDKGLKKPNKPMERLLPRPEERMAALAAISNKNPEPDKSSITSKDRQDSHSERGRKLDRNRDRCDRSKRDRMSLDREHDDYEHGLEQSYDRGHSIDRVYERVGDRYDDVPREGERSPGYSRERHYDPGYDIPGHPRGYPDVEERGYGEIIADHRGVDLGFDERRARREHSWEGSEGRLERDRERGYMPPHPHKEWEGEEFRGGGEWARDRHWQHRDQQMGEWAEKEVELEAGWHRSHAPPHQPPHARPPHPQHAQHPQHPQHPPRMHDEGYARAARAEHARPEAATRRAARGEAEAREPPPAAAGPAGEEPPVPDDLSEISDDPDDILDRDDMERAEEEDVAERAQSEERVHIKLEPGIDAYQHAMQGNVPSPPNMALVKTESQDSKDEEELKELDFEEISDGELEEERTRAGLGDALGVDWASLVAEVRRSEAPAAAAGARRRWRPADVLARVGVSVAMAGATVALERRRRVRAALLGAGCAVTRALSARRDLALRRHLCALPPERGPAAGTPPPPQPHLFHAARALLMSSG